MATGLIAQWAPYARVLSLDYDVVSLQKGAARRRGLGPRVSAACADVARLPLGDASVEAAYFRFVLQHMADPQQVLREASRAVGPGGLVCALDGDFGAMITHPHLPAVQAVRDADEVRHAQRGGDRRVGRKLLAHFASAGLLDLHARPVIATSSELGVETWQRLFVAPLMEGLDAALVHAAQKELQSFCVQPGAFGLMVGVLAWGRVPGTPS